MKRLTDYKDDEAFELWADILEPMSVIMSDKAVLEAISKNGSPIGIAKAFLKYHKDEVKSIMFRIDPTPINGLSIFTRLVSLLAEMGANEDFKTFFKSAEQEKQA